MTELYQWGYEITTTLDLNFQQKIEEKVSESFDYRQSFDADNTSSLISNIHSGDILAYIWSHDYFDDKHNGKVDMVRNIRQIWSTVKPFVYAMWFMFFPVTIDLPINDTKTNFWWWYTPNNADGTFLGRQAIKKALAGSRNIPALKMTMALGGEKTVKKFLKLIGMNSINNDENYGPSLGLWIGQISMLELAQSYMEFGDSKKVPIIHGINRIKNKAWLTIYDHTILSYRRIIPLGVAKLITHILGTPEYAPTTFQKMVNVPQCPNCSSKTGTSNAKNPNGTNVARDARLITFDPNILVTIWAGNANGRVLWSKAYWSTINTPLRNEIFTILQENNYTDSEATRNFATDQTKRYKRGEGYISPKYQYFTKRFLQWLR